MHIELYQALTHANVREEDAERVAKVLEAHMAGLVTEATKGVLAELQSTRSALETEARATRGLVEAQGKSIDRNFDITKWMILGAVALMSLGITAAGFLIDRLS